METISPELALVDRQLESTARDRLPDVSDCLVGGIKPTPPTKSRPPAAGPRNVSPLALLLTALLCLAFGIAALPRSTGTDERDAVPVATKQTKVSGVASTKPGSPARPKELRWKRVANADFYNVILWRNGTRALDLWPATAAATVPPGALKPGVYDWFVYPAFEKGTTRHYGRVIAQGRLRI